MSSKKIKTSQEFNQESNQTSDKPIDYQIYVISHGYCRDGFSASTVAYKHFKQKYGKSLESTVKFIPAAFNRSPPDCTDKIVYILDFSYSYETICDIIKVSKSCLIIDHHKTSQEALKDIPDTNKIFDMGHSGATLAHMYFYPYEPMPLFLQYIEDHDIWLHKLPDYKAFNAFMDTLDFEHETYLKYMSDDAATKAAIERFKTVSDANDALVDKIASGASCKFVKLFSRAINQTVYANVAMVNTNVFKSEVGNRIMTKKPFCDFAAPYSIKSDGTTLFSLRSTDYHGSVAHIAKHFMHGGGHRNASGCAINSPTNCITSNVINISINKIIMNCLKFKYTEINSSNDKSNVNSNDNYAYHLYAEINYPTDHHILANYFLQPKQLHKPKDTPDITIIDTIYVIKEIMEEYGITPDEDPEEYREAYTRFIDNINYENNSEFLSKYNYYLNELKENPIAYIKITTGNLRNDIYYASSSSNKDLLPNNMSIEVESDIIIGKRNK